MRTAWGYDVDDLAPLLSVEAFNTMTGGIYAGNDRVESALVAASQAIRNYCGWHICPSLECMENGTRLRWNTRQVSVPMQFQI